MTTETQAPEGAQLPPLPENPDADDWTNGQADAIEEWGRSAIAAYRSQAPAPAPVELTKEQADALYALDALAARGFKPPIGALVELLERAADALQAASADTLREPKNGAAWRVEWWNESARLMLPAGSKLDSFQSYKNGTLMFTIKRADQGAHQ